MSGGEHRCLSRLAVERYALGEMDEREARLAEVAFEECPGCRSALDDVRLDEEAFRLRPLPASLREAAVAGRKAERWRLGLRVAAPVCAAAAVAIWIGRTSTDGRSAAEIPPVGARSEGVRVMGGGAGPVAEERGVELGFYVLRDGRSVAGRPGEVLGEGERIQFWYEVPRPGRGVLVGVDGRGAVTLYHPARGSEPGPLRAGRERVFESSVILDDAVGVERFFLCFGKEGDLAASAERAATDLAGSGADLERADRLPLDCEQASVWIRKE